MVAGSQTAHVRPLASLACPAGGTTTPSSRPRRPAQPTRIQPAPPRPYLAEAALPDGTQDLEVVQVHCRESRGVPGEGAAGLVPARALGPSSLPRAPMLQGAPCCAEPPTLQGAPQHHREPPTLQGAPDTLGSPPQCREPPVLQGAPNTGGHPPQCREPPIPQGAPDTSGRPRHHRAPSTLQGAPDTAGSP